VRFIGEPRDRIREDYLRILRFFRFHAWYGDPNHGIEAEGLAACAELADGLEGLSRERVGSEMLKLLAAPDPSPSVASMGACGALMRILPGAGAHLLPVLVHIEEAMEIAPDQIRRLAAIGGSDVDEALRLSNENAARLHRLTLEMHAESTADELGYRLGAAMAQSVLALRWAMMGREPDLTAASAARAAADQQFPLSGKDVMPDLEGPQIGEALRRAEEAWIASGFALDRDALLEVAFGG
jgi:poly(A) polymerase